MITPDSRTPTGKAVIELHQLLTELEARTGQWPGADVVSILEPWMAQFDFTTASVPAVTVTAPRPRGQVWLLRRWDRHEDDVLLFADAGTALGELARHVRGSWANLLGDESIPDQPPADDRTAVDLYYGPERNNRPDEGYCLYPTVISGPGRPRIAALDYRFPEAQACERANRDALFHPQTDGNDLPCTEVDGVLVFTYLDQGRSAVCVSVHLDNPSDRLVRPDGTVPLRIEVEDTVVLDDSGVEGAPRPALLDRLLNAAGAEQREVIRSAALAAGLIWCCPACRWDNPETACCCEGPGPCRKARPPKEQHAA